MRGKKYIEKLHYIQRNVRTKILSESCCVAYIQAKELLDLIHVVNPHCKPRWDDKRRIWRKNALFPFVIEKYILLLLFFSFIEFSIWRIKPRQTKESWNGSVYINRQTWKWFSNFVILERSKIPSKVIYYQTQVPFGKITSEIQ